MDARGLITKAADAVFPYIPKCVCCGVEKGAGEYLCPQCVEQLEALGAGGSDIGDIKAYSLYKYDGPVKSIVTGYKYSNKRWLSRFMGDAMSAHLKSFPGNMDCVCNVPLHAKRKKTRGFDQSEEIAKRIAQVSCIPYIAALRRIRNTKTQTKLNERERAENIKGAFERAARVNGNVLLIDDVLTTGATALECAWVLKEAGVENVYVMTFARAVMRGAGERRTGLRKLIGRFVKA